MNSCSDREGTDKTGRHTDDSHVSTFVSTGTLALRATLRRFIDVWDARMSSSSTPSASSDPVLGRFVEVWLLGMPGTFTDGMLVRVGEHRYEQASGRPLDAAAPPFPFTKVAVKLTTWGDWKQAHPDSDVYAGSGRAAP